MGQVPNQISYGIAGDGRLARHLAHYLDLLGIPYRQWSRQRSRRLQAARGAAAHGVAMDGADVVENAVKMLGACDVILVALRDDAIEAWIEAWIAEARGFLKNANPGRALPRFVHFSGALVTPLAPGMHPLMSFGTELYERAEYERIPFVCERGGPAFGEVFPGLPNPHYEIPVESKALYHALCVMGGNFTVLLWRKVFEDLRKNFGLPAEAITPYLERVTRNLAENLEKNPEAAVTGPLARGDRATIRKNLESLSGDRFQGIYQAFVEAHSL